MKKSICLLLIIAFTLLTACNYDTDSGTGSSSSDTTRQSEETTGENDAHNTEDVNVPGNLSPIYKEKTTTMDGSVLIDGMTLKVTYKSEFYGHDSAIDRDFVQYGWNFDEVSMDFTPVDGFMLGEFCGELYADILTYGEGVLKIDEVSLKNRLPNKTIFGDVKSTYSIKSSSEFEVGINGTLRGVGDFDGNGYNDVLTVTENGEIYIGFGDADGFVFKYMRHTDHKPAELFAGYVNGDGFCDIIIIDGESVTVMYFDGEDSFTESDSYVLPFYDNTSSVYVGDINNDKNADIVLLKTADGSSTVTSLFGRGDGTFGPHENEYGNTNLYAEYTTDVLLEYIAIGDMTGDGVPDILAKDSQNQMRLYISADEPAYDYSLFGMKRGDGYILYAGGRWYDQSDAVKNSLLGDGVGDGDHVMVYFSDDGINYDRYIDKPMFYLGRELGIEDEWWIENTLEPEVIYVDGVYHMFWQCSGWTKSGYYGDMLGYASSTDGINFTRKTDSPIIVPSSGKEYTDFDIEIGFNHEEVIYVPDDPDGKCFWLYTGHFIDDTWRGYVLIRSSDPTEFCWDERESINGMSQIGNQIGYISDFDGCGNRLFVRITFSDYTDDAGTRSLPALQFSYDGRNWSKACVYLAGTDTSEPTAVNNTNSYFLGFATIDGTGEIEKNDDGSYKLIYFATTANSSGAPDIFEAEAGVGVMNFTITY